MVSPTYDCVRNASDILLSTRTCQWHSIAKIVVGVMNSNELPMVKLPIDRLMTNFLRLLFLKVTQGNLL